MNTANPAGLQPAAEFEDKAMFSRKLRACINKIAHRIGADAEQAARVRLFIEALQLKSEGKLDAEMIRHMQKMSRVKPHKRTIKR